MESHPMDLHLHSYKCLAEILQSSSSAYCRQGLIVGVPSKCKAVDVQMAVEPYRKSPNREDPSCSV
jgi:hypothetical protein